MSSKNINDRIKTLLTKIDRGLAKIYGERLDKIILYGSQARAILDSDIDILIVLKQSFSYSQKRDRISIFIADMCLEYATVISCIFATRQKYEGYDSGFFRNVRREGISIPNSKDYSIESI
ncbi:MAG: nucleotidyltransferase domain-containing protein [Hormoscilla sp. GM102CHS1]|nr:nucleotidyltransferase domain-containing protein [Hormoscilla sp. GM102CHS1]